MSDLYPAVFSVRGLPPGLLGESYVLISVWKPSDALWKAESHLLTKRPSERRISSTVEFDISEYPAELPAMDEAAMEQEALRQAEMDLIEELERRAAAENKPEIAWQAYRLERSNVSSVSLWVNNTYPNVLAEIANKTESPKLRLHLKLVMSVRKLRAP